MLTRIDWRKLSLLSDDVTLSFEKFCFHIAAHKFGDYGTVSYFYNTPGSEFYIELNKPMEYAGIKYSQGDVIGWQAKFWEGRKDENNSPLDGKHIKELIEGFNKTMKYRPSVKLWIVCSPGSFVQAQWDKLLDELLRLNPDCLFESWHKDVFEEFYLDSTDKFNGIFQYYFGAEFAIKRSLDEISKDTLACLNAKFDTDLHTPTDFERSLLSIVNKDIASKIIIDKITSLYHHSVDERKKAILEKSDWYYNQLTPQFVNAYIEDCSCRYELIENLHNYISLDIPIVEHIYDILQTLSEYRERRKNRVDLLNTEIKGLLKKKEYPSIEYHIRRLVDKIINLENEIISHKDKGDSLWGIVSLLAQKEFSIFAEAGYGKTHFACSITDNMLKRGLPVLLLTGSQFRNCNSCEGKLVESLNYPLGMSFTDVLDAFDFMGEIYSCKVPIVIDGLNESAPNENRWIDELPPLQRKIKERKNLLLITTCREKEEYINAIYGCRNYKDIESYIYLEGIANKSLSDTVERYFKKYNISPSNHIVHDYFTNPLLLKVFCLTNRDKHDFELNDFSLASCMKEYSELLINTIAKESGKISRVKRHNVECNLNKIAQIIWDRNNRCLDYFNDFVSIFEDDSEKFLEEGMCFLLERVGNEEQIQFSYDMLAGYYIAKSILDQCSTKDDFCTYIRANYNKLWGINRHTLAEDISKSLFYLVPSKYKKEWFELMPDENIAKTSIDNIDIVISSAVGRESFVDFLKKNSANSIIKKNMLDALFKRTYEHSNLLHLSLFLPFFTSLETKEIDVYWNCNFAGYGILEKVHSLLNERFLSKRYEAIDKIMLAALLCGITDTEYREKFHERLLLLLEENPNHLSVCHELLTIKDPFIFESLISVITGIGLKSHDFSLIKQCIHILEKYLYSYTSNHIVLLDNLETLYSYSEEVFGIKYERTILYKNFDELWPTSDEVDFNISPIYSYDYEKYYIRPLFGFSNKDKNPFDADDIFNMLKTRIKELGYDEEVYIEVQRNEDVAVKYRQNMRCNYAYKYGRHALMELYGWMVMHLYMGNEFKGTFRTSIIDIDPSHPKFLPLKNFVNKSFMPHSLAEVPKWIETNSVDYLKDIFVTNLPKKDGEWILLRGFFTQNIDNRFVHLHMSGTSQLVPIDIKDEIATKLELDYGVDYSHIFSGEIGWRELEFTEEYDSDSAQSLMIEYSFSSWSSSRFRYKRFYGLHPKITKEIGLSFDVKTMSYYLNDEKVSEYYINETDHFFYLRKDIVDKILRIYNAKILFRMYESRTILQDCPKNLKEIPNKYAQHELEIFYKYSKGPNLCTKMKK